MALQAACYKFSIVNEAVPIRIHHCHEVINVVVGHGAARNLSDTYLQLLGSQLTISIFIKLRKSLP